MTKIDLSGIWNLSCDKPGFKTIPAQIPGFTPAAGWKIDTPVSRMTPGAALVLRMTEDRIQSLGNHGVFQRGILERAVARRIQPDRSSSGGESGRVGGQTGNRTENRWHKIADGGD